MCDVDWFVSFVAHCVMLHDGYCCACLCLCNCVCVPCDVLCDSVCFVSVCACVWFEVDLSVCVCVFCLWLIV